MFGLRAQAEPRALPQSRVAAQPLVAVEQAAVEQAAVLLRLAAAAVVVAPVAELPAAVRYQKYSDFRLAQ